MTTTAVTVRNFNSSFVDQINENFAAIDTALTNVQANVTSLAALKALSATSGIVVSQYRTTAGDGGGGIWVWRSGNQSANITADTRSGLWAAPDSDSTGASGAWQRQFSGPLIVEWFGAAGDGTTDNTTAIQAAITAAQNAGSGTVFFGDNGNYKVTGTLTISSNGVQLVGASRQTVILFANGSSNCINITNGSTQISNFKIADLYLNHSGKTGGITINANIVSNLVVENVTIDQCWNGVLLTQTNTVEFRNVTINAPNASDYGMKFDSPTSANASGLTLIGLTVQCSYGGADCFVWDGWATTLRMQGVALLGGRYNFRVQNTRNSSSAYPAYAYVDDLECDGASTTAMQIDAGFDFHFVNCDITNTSGASGQGNADLDTIVINPDASYSVTKFITFTGCQIGNTRRRAVNATCRNLQFSNCALIDVSKAGSGSYPVVELGAGGTGASTSNVIFTGCKIGTVQGATARASYAVVLNSGVTRSSVVGCDLYENVTGGISDSSGSATNTFFANTGYTGARDTFTAGGGTFAGDVTVSGTLSAPTIAASSGNQVVRAGSSSTLVLGVTGASADTMYINNGAAYPVTNNAVTLGTGSYRWSTAYAVNGDFSGTMALGSTTWANIPAAGTAGRLAFVSNAGTKGSIWLDDGTRWKPINGSVVLATLDTASSNIGSSETIVFQYLIPAGLWQTGDRLRLYIGLTKSGTTDTGNFLVRIGTAGTTSDALIGSKGLLSAAANRQAAAITDFRLDSATSVTMMPNTRNTLGYAATANAAIDSSVAISSASSNALYVSVSLQSSGAADTIQMVEGQLHLISKAN